MRTLQKERNAASERRTGRFFVSCAVAWCALGSGTAGAESPVDRFLAHLDGRSDVPAEATALIRRTWADCQDCDGEEFLTQGLAVLSPPLREGLDAYEAGNNDECAAIMAELRTSDDPFVATHAAAYEIKALVAAERLLEAGDRIVALTRDRPVDETDVATYSYFAPEIAFLRGYTLLADLRYDEAAVVLSAFLRDYPDSSQRLVVAAEQMLGELQTRQPEQIGEVADLMNFAGRRLNHLDAGESVRTRQQRIVDLLDKLIEEAENNEKNSSSSSSGGSDGSKSQNAPSNPMNESKLPGGAPPQGSLGERQRANPAESWGAMPPAERARILQALRDNFPSRYRQLVEQYYEELAKKP